MSFSVNNHSIDKRSTWSFDQWSFWHELNIELAETIILLFQMSNDTQLWVSLFLKRKLSENLGTENSISLFSETEYHLTFLIDFLQTFRSYSFQSAVFTNIISNSKALNCIFRKMLNIEILENFASANQFEHQNHQFPPPELIYARWLPHILWKT